MFVEKGRRIKIGCGIYLELPVWFWDQAQKLNMVKDITKMSHMVEAEQVFCSSNYVLF